MAVGAGPVGGGRGGLGPGVKEVLGLGEVVVVEDDEFWIQGFDGADEGTSDERMRELVLDEAVDSGAFQNGFGVSDVGAVWMREDRFHGGLLSLWMNFLQDGTCQVFGGVSRLACGEFWVHRMGTLWRSSIFHVINSPRCRT